MIKLSSRVDFLQQPAIAVSLNRGAVTSLKTFTFKRRSSHYIVPRIAAIPLQLLNPSPFNSLNQWKIRHLSTRHIINITFRRNKLITPNYLKLLSSYKLLTLTFCKQFRKIRNTHCPCKPTFYQYVLQFTEIYL